MAANSPPGLAFEHYDQFGKYREQHNGQPIDVTGAFAGNGDLTGTFTDTTDVWLPYEQAVPFLYGQAEDQPQLDLGLSGNITITPQEGEPTRMRGLAVPEFKGRVPEPVVYEGETPGQRVARRKQKWTPTEIVWR